MAREQREERADTLPGELKNTTYEFFMATLSIRSIVNLGVIVLTTDPVVEQIMRIVDIPLNVIFLGDFGFRLATADSRRGYVLRRFGWADLLSCVPLPSSLCCACSASGAPGGS